MDARPLRSSVALMYHALGADSAHDPGQDAHYTIAGDVFDRHLRDCRSTGAPLSSARDWLAGNRAPAILLSFDDGHRSNYSEALPLLQRHGASADFFVNSANVGSQGFASWSELRAMAEAGQSIQSHSHTHRYLTTLSSSELRGELTRSKAMIEDAIGQPVTLLAPPGGRMPADLAATARDCGYQHVLSSRPGRITGHPPVILPRMAVTAQLDAATLSAWLQGDAATFFKAGLRYATLAALKGLFGDRGYERLRAFALGRTGGG